MTELSGARVLVTGAASGIGRELAREAVARGASVVAWDLDAAGLEALARELDPSCVTDVCDVSDPDAVREAAREVLDSQGPVDVLINNAGIVSGKPLLELSDAQIQRTFGVNSLALFWTTRAFLPGMLERGRGHVVTLASAAGVVGTSGLVDYCASKHAAVGFDDALRVELHHAGHRDVRTTVVCPYYVGTGMFDGVRSRFLPILDPERTAGTILKAVARNQPRVFLPWTVRWTYLGRIFPTPVLDAILRGLGISQSMDEFHGRGGQES